MSEKYFCFGDFEFTCGVNISMGTCEMLSVGLIICDERFRIAESFYCTARPVKYPKMTKQCVKLTKLDQQEIFNSPDSNSVLLIVRRLMKKYGCDKLYVWGNFDRPGLFSDAGMHRRLKKDPENIQAVAKSIEDIQRRLVKRLGLPEAVNIAELSSVFGFVPHQGTYHNALNDAMGLYEIYRGAYGTDCKNNKKLRALIDDRIAKREERRLKAAERRREIALSVTLSDEERVYLDSFGEKRDEALERLLELRYPIINFMKNHPDEDEYELIVFDEPLRFKLSSGSAYTPDKGQSAIVVMTMTKSSFGRAVVDYMKMHEREAVLTAE